MKEELVQLAIRVPLGNGYYARVDAADYHKIRGMKWTLSRNRGRFYAIHTPATIRMHSVVFGGPAPDHIDNDGLNNVKSNLRAATRSQNAMNFQKRSSKCSSRFKGVCWIKRENKWKAYITVQCKRVNLGQFHDEWEAAQAYNTAALKHFGEYARLNERAA